MLFTQISQLVIYHILTFVALVSITIVNLHLDGVSYAVSVKILINRGLCSIRSWKEVDTYKSLVNT